MALQAGITEIPRNQIESYDDAGLKAVRVFDALATSGLHAYSLLWQRYGIMRNVIYVSPQGETPDLRVRCRQLSGQERKAPAPGGLGRYQITAQYSKADRQEPEPDPDATPVYEWDASIQSGPVDVDLDGTPIVNSAGEAFDPPITADISYASLTVRWFRASFDPRNLITFSDAINSTKWTPADPHGEGVYLDAGEAKCLGIKRTPINDGLIQLEARFALDRLITVNNPAGDGGSQLRSPFLLHVMDRGRRYVKDAGEDPPERYASFKDGDGKDVDDPILMDGAGAALGDGDDPVVLTFRRVKQADFNVLGI